MLTVFVVLASVASAQDGTAAGDSIVKRIIDGLSNMLIPALWVSFGPVAVKAVTLTVNSWTQKYVPRGLQVPLAGFLGAVFAGLTGDMTGIDPNLAVSIGGASGVVGQILTSLHPDTMTASASPKTVVVAPPKPAAQAPAS